MTDKAGRSGFNITSIAQAREIAAKAKTTMAKWREKNEEVIGRGMQLVEVSGTAFAFGFANSRWGENGELKIAGIPVDLGVAAVVHSMGFLGGLGEYAEHGHNVADGALASFAYRVGAQMGADSARDAKGPPPVKKSSTTAGALPSGHRVFDTADVGGGAREYTVVESDAA